MKTTTKPNYTFIVDARPAKLGGGWQLKLLEDGLEVGGGVYPARDEAEEADAYNDAVGFGQNWLDSRPNDDTTIPQIAPEYVDVLDRPLPHAKDVFAQLAAAAYPRTSLENVEDVLQAIERTASTKPVAQAQQATPSIYVDAEFREALDSVAAEGKAYEYDVLRLIVCVDATLAQARVAGQALAGLTFAVHDVLAERQRQISGEGWTPVHDDKHDAGAMARAAAVYALIGSSDGRVMGDELTPSITQRLWPWGRNWLKPKSKRRNLIRAGALILAEIERIDRAAARASSANTQNGGAS